MDTRSLSKIESIWRNLFQVKQYGAMMALLLEHDAVFNCRDGGCRACHHTDCFCECIGPRDEKFAAIDGSYDA